MCADKCMSLIQIVKHRYPTNSPQNIVNVVGPICHTFLSLLRPAVCTKHNKNFNLKPVACAGLKSMTEKNK